MRYSLLSRFRGALLGASLGELLGTCCSLHLQAKRPLPHLVSAAWLAEPLPIAAPGWGSLAVQVAERLIAAQAPRLSPIDRAAPPAGAAIAALPIALFFHEDLDKLLSQLAEATAPMQLGADVGGGVLAVSTAIAMAVQEQLHPPRLIPQLVEQSIVSSPLADQLQQIQPWLHQGSFATMLSAVAAHASDSVPSALLPFSLAFYCFLSSPEEYGLTLRRLAIGISQTGRSRLMAQLPVLAGICGALSGAYNGTAGIPAAWRSGLNCPADDPPLAGLWSFATEARIDQLAEQLLAVWSGVYSASAAGARLPVTAAPYLIRAR